MIENVTFESIVDEAAKILADDYSEFIAHQNLTNQIKKCYFPLLIVIGVPCNLLALLVLIRCRLWLHHEAYIYLAAVLVVNVVTLSVFCGDLFLALIDDQLMRLSISADVVCKLWVWLIYVIHYSFWFHVLMLLNVYLRQQQLITYRYSDRRGCFMNLAARYCSLLGTKIVIISSFTLYAVGNFWAFSVSSLEQQEDAWKCTILDPYYERYALLIHAYLLTEFISLIVVLPILLLVAWNGKRNSGIVFTLQDNCDAEALTRIAVCCTVAAIVLKAPLIIMDFIWYTNSVNLVNYKIVYKIHDAARLIYLAYLLSTPIICFAVESRFRGELRTMALRCRPGANSHGTLSPNLQRVIAVPLSADEPYRRRLT